MALIHCLVVACNVPVHAVCVCRYVEAKDQTDILQEGYWASYNIPFYEDIFNVSGYSAAVEAHGTEFSYQLCPRAKIFRRDQGKVSVTISEIN